MLFASLSDTTSTISVLTENGDIGSHSVLSAVDMFSVSINYLVGVLGTLGNSLTIAILLHSQMLKKTHNVLIMNQSFVDLFASITILLVQVRNKYQLLITCLFS